MSQSAPASALPLFYRQPEPLSPAQHGELKVRDGNLSFAADTAYVPVMTSEFAFASRDYPLLFAARTAAPIALVGLRERNLFLDGGDWLADTYVPAYVRRYPFTTVRMEDDGQGNGGFVMVVDAACDRFGADEGMALFENGEPSFYTRQVMQFCEQFHLDALATEAFSAALMAQEGLLIDRRADVTLPSGEKLGVDGFRVVDPERFAALDEATVADWHRKGWLALIHFHLASLERFQNLLRRQAALTPPSANAA